MAEESDTPPSASSREPEDGRVDGVIASEPLPLVPEGEYTLMYEGYETRVYFQNAPKLSIKFTIADQGPYFGVTVVRHYNVKSLLGPPRKGGRFTVARGSDLVRELSAVASPSRRLDRISLGVLKSKPVVGRIATVRTCSRQRSLAPSAQYSVVRQIIREHGQG